MKKVLSSGWPRVNTAEVRLLAPSAKKRVLLLFTDRRLDIEAEYRGL
jgi:hypothetical protein